jgi:K+-sensing histidine kinase KdpD
MSSDTDNIMSRHPSVVFGLSAVLPPAVCLMIAPFRASLENTNAALLLVLLVVAAASTGLRFAGIVAALSSALSFDFFLTAPIHRLAITDRADIETAVLLVLVGAAVTEIALWGRRQLGQASRQRGYLDGVLQTVAAVATKGTDPAELTDVVGGQIREVLHIDACRFIASPRPVTSARLNQDGLLTRDGRPVDVGSSGLPTDTETELLVQNAGVVQGRYLLTSATRISRPKLEQRRVAVALADQVGAALAVQAGHRHTVG